MKNILITANTDRHIILCHLPYIKYLQENGYKVDIATNTDKPILSANKINLELKRNPFCMQNIKAIFKLKQILMDNHYDIIHTHTPVGSVVTRLAYKLSHYKAKVIYTCHGFHFYKGAPLHYWLIFYPIEKYLMKYTDKLLVMNDEDFKLAKKHFKNVDIELIKGAGFNKDRLEKRYKQNEIDEIYKKNDISKDSFIVSYIAELSKRKRQVELIKTLSKTNIKKENIQILLIGDNILKEKVQKEIIKYNLEDKIKVIDFTLDIGKYFDISNLIISASRQEGLPLNIMEAIYKKKFVVATKCRGNVDLIKDGVNGFVVDKIDEIYPKILYVKNNYKNIMENYQRYINIDEYDSKHIVDKMSKIYNEIIEEND